MLKLKIGKLKKSKIGLGRDKKVDCMTENLLIREFISLKDATQKDIGKRRNVIDRVKEYLRLRNSDEWNKLKKWKKERIIDKLLRGRKSYSVLEYKNGEWELIARYISGKRWVVLFDEKNIIRIWRKEKFKKLLLKAKNDEEFAQLSGIDKKYVNLKELKELWR